MESPIYYMGNKARSRAQIVNHIDGILGKKRVYLDAFCGTGIMTAAFNERSRTISCDIQRYAVDITKGILLESEKKTHFISELDYIEEMIAERYFELASRFSKEIEAENLVCAGREAAIREYREALSIVRDQTDSDIIRNLAGCYLTLNGSLWADAAKSAEAEINNHEVQLMLRCALLRFASLTSITTAAQFAQPNLIATKLRETDIRKIVGARDKHFRLTDYVTPFLNSGAQHKYEVVCRNANSILEMPGLTGGLLYADPPYGREHYSRFYHVLEFLSHEYGTRYSNISNSRESSAYGIRSKAYRALTELTATARARGMSVAVSYVSDKHGEPVKNRVLSVDQITQCIKDSHGEFELREIFRDQYSGFSKSSYATGRVSNEILIIAR